MSQSKKEALEKLKKSRFRSSFHLTEKEKEYYLSHGHEVMEQHARDFVRQRLAPANPYNDGKQTPMKGHPIFKAQHATACCCRGCLQKWYHVPKGVELTSQQQEKIVQLLLYWCEEEINKKK